MRPDELLRKCPTDDYRKLAMVACECTEAMTNEMASLVAGIKKAAAGCDAFSVQQLRAFSKAASSLVYLAWLRTSDPTKHAAAVDIARRNYPEVTP